MAEVEGRVSFPPYMGQRPPSILNRELLPHPLGPDIRRWSPGFTLKVKGEATMSLLGVTMGTSSKIIVSSLEMTSPQATSN